MELSINCGGVETWQPGSDPIPTGGYVFVIVSEKIVNQKARKGETGKNIELELKIVDGKPVEAGARNPNGRTTRVWIGIPGSVSDSKRNEIYARQWRALFESLGYEPAQLDAGPINFDSSALVNKQVYGWTVENNREQNGGTDFIRKAFYDAYLNGEWTGPTQGAPRRDANAGQETASMAMGMAGNALAGGALAGGAAAAAPLPTQGLPTDNGAGAPLGSAPTSQAGNSAMASILG